MPDKNFLAFDLGAESGRSVLGTLSGGEKLDLDVTHRFPSTNGTINGSLQWDVLSIWKEMKYGLRETAGADARSDVTLSGIGVDTWGVDFGLLGPSDELLGNPTHYRDARTHGMFDKVFTKVPREQVFESTGLQFMELNTLFQLAAMRMSGSKLLDFAQTLLFMPDLLHFLLCGRKANEFSIVSTSQLYDPRKKTWASDLLSALDIPERLFAPIVPSGTVLGSLRPDIATECGVKGDIRVIAPASHDTGSAVAAVPAEGRDGWCYISSGTWSLIGVELNQPLINADVLRENFTNEGGVGGSIRFLKNIVGLWIIQECRRHWAKEDHDHSYSELTEMAGRSKPFGAVLDSDYPPLLRPGDMPLKIDDFFRKTRQRGISTRGEYVRTCLESLAMTYRRRVEGLEKLLGRSLSVIHIVGGGSQNELLNQMTADACNRTVLAGPTEATAAGNVIVQAMATGDIKSLSDGRAIICNSFPVKRYEPQHAKAWEGPYKKYRELVGQ